MKDLPQGPFDAIVIGSGIGSLTTAVLLAKLQHKRVLVLEQHFTIGGQTHAFKRRGRFEFDVGIHYIGDMGKGMGRRLFDYLTEGQLQWQPMPPEFQRYVYPDFEFSVPSNPREYKRRLIEMFPLERAAIEQYFTDLRSAVNWYGAAHLVDAMPPLARLPLRFAVRSAGRVACTTLGAYLDRHFRSPQLKALLASQWGDYGLPPSQAAFGMHALVEVHYWRGGWYPVGGAKRIAEAMVPIIERAGGVVLAAQTVDEILVERGAAVGVRCHNTIKPHLPPHEFRAPLIVSGAGADVTYNKLLPASVPIPFRAELQAQSNGVSAVCVYLGLKDSPATLGVKGENHWVYGGYDHDAALTSGKLGNGYYLSFPSLKNPQAHARGHTADIITFAAYEPFKQWAEGQWKKRGEDYEALKRQIAEQLIGQVDEHLPGFADLVSYIDVSTPLSMEHFVGHRRGAFYGVPATPKRLFQPWTRAQSPVRNLYLTGCDVMSAGVVGALIGGIKTAGVINGQLGFMRLMRQMLKAGRPNAPQSSPGLAAWPDTAPDRLP